MDGRVALVGVLWAVSVGVAVGVELTCQNGCRCWVQNPNTEMEYRVICSGTPNQTSSLTESVFEGSRPDEEYKTYVRVEGSGPSSRLLVTEGFLQRWREYYSCVLDVWRVRDVRLPHVTTFLPAVPASWEHVFAGIGLLDVNMDAIPSGLFSGKQNAGLRLIRSSVGRISPNLFRHVGFLKYLKVQRSRIGLFDGPLSSEDFIKVLDSNLARIQIEDSSIGRFGEGSLRLSSKSSVDLVLRDTIVGELSPKAIDLFGPVNLVVDSSQVAHLTRQSLSLRGRATLAITNSTILAQTESLSDVECSEGRNRIHSNRFMVLPEGQVGLGNQTEDLDLRISNADVLRTILHPTCVANNLFVRPKHELPVEAILYALTALSILVVAILVCLLVRKRPLGRPRNRLNDEVIVMSQLNDSIYEEPSVLRTLPPPVPPPSGFLASYTAKLEAQTGAACSTAPNSSCGPHFAAKVVENDYMKMR